MKVKANCRINHSGTWYVSGDVFDMPEADAKSLGSALTVVSKEPVQEIHDIQATLNNEVAETPKRGRRKKTEE